MSIQGFNGEQFGAKWKAYEQAMQRHNDFGLKGQEVAEQMGRYAEGLQYDQMKAFNKAQGREYARMLAAERQALTNGLSGASTTTTNPLNLTTSNNGINVVRKTKVGTKKTGFKYFFADDAGKVYQVDKSAYNAIGKKGNIKLSGAMANPVKAESLPNRVKQQFNRYMVSDVTKDVTKLYQGKHPANTQLGTANATPSSGMTWKKYAEQHGTTYTPPTSGVGEADRRAAAIIKGNQEKQRVKDILGQKTEFNPANLDKWAGLGPNKELDNMNDYYRALEGRSKSGFSWKKAGKWAAIGLGVAAVVGLAVWGIKKYNESKEAKLEDLEPSPQPTPTPTPQPGPIVPPVKPEPAPQPVAPVEPTEPAEPAEPVKPNLPVDPDGTYTTKKGDTFWGIAKKHLADKYQDQPEKFANLTEKQQNVLIQKECERIMKANGYWYDDNHNLPNPMLYTNKKLVIEANMNIAA